MQVSANELQRHEDQTIVPVTADECQCRKPHKKQEAIENRTTDAGQTDALRRSINSTWPYADAVSGGQGCAATKVAARGHRHRLFDRHWSDALSTQRSVKLGKDVAVGQSELEAIHDIRNGARNAQGVFGPPTDVGIR